MAENASFRWADGLWFVLIVAVAAGARLWYLQFCLAGATALAPPLVAQDNWPQVKIAHGEKRNGKDNPTSQDQLIHYLRQGNWFGGTGPLAPIDAETDLPVEETTAHVAPGYPWLVAQAYRLASEEQVPALIRWIQCGLGALTAGLYFFFVRRAFGHLLAAVLAGLLCAFHPFWIINTGEINDGVLVTLALAVCLVFGTRSTIVGGPFSSLTFGLALAGLALVRAALLPFAFVGLLWFLLRCRAAQRGWLCAVLAVLGFANGVTAWTVHNYQQFRDIVPIADSAFVHLWMGNNPKATGGPQTEEELRSALPQEKLKDILAEENQAKRYQMLAPEIIDYIKDHPAETVRNRIWAGLYFYFGEGWFASQSPRDNKSEGNLASAAGEQPSAAWITPAAPADESRAVPAWLVDNNILIINSMLLGMLVLGLLGWRWTYAWRKQAGLAALAVMWIPLPYLLSHAGRLWGPRLPLDGVLLSYAAFAVVYLIPVVRGNIPRGPRRESIKDAQE